MAYSPTVWHNCYANTSMGSMSVPNGRVCVQMFCANHLLELKSINSAQPITACISGQTLFDRHILQSNQCPPRIDWVAMETVSCCSVSRFVHLQKIYNYSHVLLSQNFPRCLYQKLVNKLMVEVNPLLQRTNITCDSSHTEFTPAHVKRLAYDMRVKSSMLWKPYKQ